MEMQLTNGPDIHDTNTTIGQICTLYVIAIAHNKIPCKKFQYLLIYEDNTSGYVILRPVIKKTDTEIAMTLFQIFTQCGSAKTIDLCGYYPDLAENISSVLSNLCPIFNVVIRHMPMKFETPAKVTEALDVWRAGKSEFWELGCAVVQWNLNNQTRTDPFDKKSMTTPQKLFLLSNNRMDKKSPDLCDMNGIENDEEDIEIEIDVDLDKDPMLLC